MEKRFEGVQAATARACDMPTQWISDVFNGRREIGERAARKIEENVGLPVGWLDKSSGRAPAQEMLEVVVDGEVIATVAASAAVTFRLRR
ncbi:MAG: XRE family transcriptional regulator [Burkholderiales bacterium]|nr:MAG: XRE family transcriptional regulator [Burkholderiales bacterium]